MSRWQYPSRAEGFTPPIPPLPDRWIPQKPDLRRSVIFPIALLAAGMFFVNPTAAQQEAATKVDGWHHQISQPYFPKQAKPHLYPTFFAPERQPDLQFQGWNLTQDISPRGIHRKPHLETGFFGDFTSALAAPVITADMWHSAIEQPYLRKQAAPHLYPSFFKDNLQPFPEGIAWHPPLQQPYLKRGRIERHPSLFTDFQEAVQIEIITVDKWHPPIQQPYLRKLSQPHLYPFFAFEPPVEDDITMDRWYAETAKPVWLKPRAVEFPDFFIDPTAFTIVSAVQPRIFLIDLIEQTHQRLDIVLGTHQILTMTSSEFFRLSFTVREIG